MERRKKVQHALIGCILFLCILNFWQADRFSKVKKNIRSSSYSSTENGKKQSYSSPKIEKDYYDVCIVGAGLSGAVIAEQYASQLGMSSIVIEKRDHVGGNCYDYIDEETGILVNKYGAHLFHTNFDRVWKYVQQFSEWSPYEHKVLGHIDLPGAGEGEDVVVHVPIPVNIDTVNTLFNTNIQSPQEMDDWLQNEQMHYDHPPSNSEEMALSRVGPRLYDLIFKPYTLKQWDKSPAELGPEVMARIPVRNDWDDRYFPNDIFQALPLHGYTAMFDKLLSDPLIEVHTNMDYFKVKNKINCGHTYFSGPIDAYFADVGYEKLEYRSIDFERVVVKNMDEDFFQPASVVNYPSGDYDFTRIVEYKHFPTNAQPHQVLEQEAQGQVQQSLRQTQKSRDTVLFYERSKDDGDPYYPVPNDRNKNLYAKYQEMAEKEEGITFVGRLANYKYFNMDQSIQNALELFDSHAPKVVVLQHLQNKTGGPEALLQLLLAFHAWMPSRTFYYQQSPGGEEMKSMWFDDYPKLAELTPLEPSTDLKAGDIFIIPEINNCPTDLVEKGVQVFIYQLGQNDAREKVRQGCRYISHNFYLSKQNGIDVPRSHVIIPYMNVRKTHFGPIDNSRRENIIILNHIDNDGAGWEQVNQDLMSYCIGVCNVIRPKGMSALELNDLYSRSKVIIATCMRGSERMPIEAALAGLIIVTNDCDNSKDVRDFPLPREHIFNERNKLVDIVQSILDNFEEEQAKLDNFRSMYKNFGHLTMIEETKEFYKAAAQV
mmetsp:Transcript_19352/g.28983  ORF Transcript_19352/g.28983 Transcript_19352/m.28983 type:complete len:769 (+) Transcript_19352:151-2457(+)|eukprot:CAMPEP_0203664706 /NCGR_PEP_ID=MMETSP0090-20130426/2070_1 /ASSEMBLY_ACC=CAM_ASM_001088 /TAXON_ID=426623 /ORGANISM="Chaetoceros affinis, Strain CCMP159" /LENGTH=768 /DNA_ID=CAMNT_0050528041 /DNA_START=143 /DNA_END=2449 /DNA_ORIENTATION=+